MIRNKFTRITIRKRIFHQIFFLIDHLSDSAHATAVAAAAALNAFPNFPFMHHNMVNTTSPMMTGALNSLAQSVAPMGPFNPMALAGM